MNCWEILGIDSTEDIKKIKRAYAVKLKQLDIATQQDLFEELRDALEKAKLQAQSGEFNQINEEPQCKVNENPGKLNVVVKQQDDFVTHLEVLYADFSRRIQLTEWQQLLADSPNWTLEHKQQCSGLLFKFLLENYYLPADILSYLEKQFDWREQQLQLIKYHDEAAIERLFRLMTQPLGFPSFEFLQELPSQVADHYIELRWAGRQALVNNNTDKVFEYLLQAYELYKKDPYLLRLLGTAFERVGRKEQALDCYYAGFELVNDDYDLLLRAGRLEQQSQNWDAAARAYMAALKINSEHLGARKGLIGCILHSEPDQETLDDIYQSLSHLIEYNPLDIQLLLLQVERDEVTNHGEPSAKLSLGYWVILAKAQIYSQDYSEAENSIRKAEQLDKTDDIGYQQLLTTKADLFFKQERYQDALPSLRLLLDFESVTANVFYQLAACILFSEKEGSKDCLAYINQAIALDSNNPEFYSVRGKYYTSTAQYAEAAKDYQQVIAKGKSDNDYWFRLGHSQFQIEQFEQAMTSYQHCLEIDETDQFAQVEIFACYLALGQNQKALSGLQKFLKENPEHIRALWLQAETYRYNGMLDEAMAAYRHGFERHEVADMGAWLAYLLLKTKRYFLAHKSLKQLAQYEGYAFWAYLQLGLLALHFDKKIKGFYFLNKAFDAVEEEQLAYGYGAYFLLGVSHYYDDDKPASANAFKQALIKEPNCAMSYAYLSIIQAETNQQNETLESINKALALEPKNSRSREWLEVLACAIKGQLDQLPWSIKWKYFGFFSRKPGALIANKVVLPETPQLVDKPIVGDNTCHPSNTAEQEENEHYLNEQGNNEEEW